MSADARLIVRAHLMLPFTARRATHALRLAPLIVAGMILGCATPPPTPPPAPPAGHTAAPAAEAAMAPPEPAKKRDDLPQVPITGALMYQLMAAELAAQQGDLGSAYAIYLKLARETKDPRLAQRAAELALQGRALQQSLEAAELWRQLAPSSKEAAQALALLYASSGRFDDAYRILAPEIKNSANPALELSRLQRQLARAQDRKGAFVLLERLAQPYLADAEVRLVLGSGAHAAGLTERSVAEAKAAIALKPDDERTVLSAAPLLQATDRATALDALKRLLERPGASSDVRLAYARMLVADKQYAAARAQFELLQQADPQNADLAYSLALLSMQGRLYSDAKVHLLRYIALLETQQNDERDPDTAYLYLAQIAEEEQQYADALKWLRKIEGGEEYIPARVREAGVLTKMQRPDEARKLLRGVTVSTPDERMQLLLAEAQVLRESRRYEDAYKLLTQALEKSPDNVALLYDAAMTAEKLDRIDAMEKYLRRVMELRADYAHAYNALGYTFADRNVRLTEALQLIEKAHQLAPDDPYILDSLGWVYFRLGDMQQARRYLEMAYDARPDAEVMIHLAEVLWVSGDQARARTLLRDAKTKEPGNELLKSTIARLRIGL
ncbi:MAG TPA: tetratricopeptide repeat protein [Burkholderiaceae bacterium]|nr:tetratricopeptide repeat protein [Burkholderiaceae bacterium]